MITPERFANIARTYSRLRIGIVGDFCLDRYLEIDPAREEISIEIGLPVHNVVRVRSQPGGAGTILNNLVALGVSEVFPIGFCGDDGEGYELLHVLRATSRVRLDDFVQTDQRRTFTYCKPLVLEPGKPPRELNRLDSKNWTPTPPAVEEKLSASLRQLSAEIDALIMLDQVDLPETGAITRGLLETLGALAADRPHLLIIADSRRSLKNYPAVCLKMNEAELIAMTGGRGTTDLKGIKALAGELAHSHGRSVFVTLSKRGIVGATPLGEQQHVPALPTRGEIDVVGAGDAVTANLAVALAAGATLWETLAVAMIAASIVVHQVGTTGTASVAQISELLTSLPRLEVPE